MSGFKSRWANREEGQPLPANPFVSSVSSLPSGSGKNLNEIGTKKKEREGILCPSGRARGGVALDRSPSEQTNRAKKSLDPLVTPLTELTKALGFTEEEALSLLGLAEALVTVHGGIKWDAANASGYIDGFSGTWETAIKALVRHRSTCSWGIIGTTGGKALMKWGKPPSYAYEKWRQ